jgi:hypothetical protein
MQLSVPRELALTSSPTAHWPSAQRNGELNNKNGMRNILTSVNRVILLPFIIKSLSHKLYLQNNRDQP